MASQSYIIRQIEEVVDGKYSKWQLGVTDEPLTRKVQVGNPLTWLHWKADSEQEALNVESYFLNKCMQIDSRATKKAVYVYIYNAGD